MSKINVTIWNENIHERKEEDVAAIYPNGIHGAIYDALKNNEDFNLTTATLEQPDQGLPDEIINNTDVLIWWGHEAHDEVKDELVEKLHKRILCGMGFIPLHSSHGSKLFSKLMGTTCGLQWRISDDKERLWVIDPGHPIAEGIPSEFVLEKEEMYGEPFDVPPPDELIMLGWFKSGEVFRSACCYKRAYGRIFYFQPGHETYPIYYNENVMKVIENAVYWAKPRTKTDKIPWSHPDALEQY